ncbi:hypothetical protein Sango_3056500 [Sesamum angolense]|uniref:Integrase catalytic domain-containing protein n=1 Tax=Sesamum angolense TaxID=2727404 RepID=A0AAE1T943_9LAMI|nr:hypothetical protein Sango_3056500 [Sesamum angolense]
MQPLGSPCPFDQWGIDIVGKLLKAIGQKEYLIVAIDYFSKWNLKTRLDEAKGNWVEELLGVLWAYRSTPRKSTGESPYNMVYGSEAIIPVKIGEETWRIRNYEPDQNSEARRIKLDLLEEVRRTASSRIEAYKGNMAKAYNSRVRARNFQICDLVL